MDYLILKTGENIPFAVMQGIESDKDMRDKIKEAILSREQFPEAREVEIVGHIGTGTCANEGMFLVRTTRLYDGIKLSESYQLTPTTIYSVDNKDTEPIPEDLKRIADNAPLHGYAAECERAINKQKCRPIEAGELLPKNIDVIWLLNELPRCSVQTSSGLHDGGFEIIGEADDCGDYVHWSDIEKLKKKLKD